MSALAADTIDAVSADAVWFSRIRDQRHKSAKSAGDQADWLAWLELGGAHSEARRVEAELTNPCGTTAAYSRGCHCQPCRDAHSAYERARRHRRDAA